MDAAKEPVDVAYVVIGRWNGVEQVWRAGVFDSPEEARTEFEIHASVGDFVRVHRIEIP